MAIAHDDMAILGALKVPPPTYANRWKRMPIEDIEILYDGRRAHFSVEVDYRVDEDRNVIVGTVRYDGQPVEIPKLAGLIEEALQEDQT